MNHMGQPTTADRAQSMMQALQEFRRERERETSEFAAEFQRLDTAQKDCLALLESASLTPALAGGNAVLQDGQVKLLWLKTLANGRVTLCFSGTQEALERSLRRGKEAAAAFSSETWTLLIPQPPEEVRRLLVQHQAQITPAIPGSPDRSQHPRRTIAETAPLLEMTDDELRRLALSWAPELGRAGLNAMRKEELVDLCSHLQHTGGRPPHRS